LTPFDISKRPNRQPQLTVKRDNRPNRLTGQPT
jgi:hypothetical protein